MGTSYTVDPKTWVPACVRYDHGGPMLQRLTRAVWYCPTCGDGLADRIVREYRRKTEASRWYIEAKAKGWL